MPSTIKINEEDLEVVNQFQYLDSTTTDSLSLNTELSKRIEKAATTLTKIPSGFGKTNTSLSPPNSKSTGPVSSVPCFTAANLGRPMRIRKENFKPSI